MAADHPLCGNEPDDALSRWDRVFPGLSRNLNAHVSGQTLAAEAMSAWRGHDDRVGTVDADGVFRARDSGTVTVSGAGGEIRVSVLGALVRVTGSVDRVGLADAEARGRFSVIGHDASGYSAPIDPADVRLAYDTSLLAVTPEAGGFTVAARAPWAVALVTAAVGEYTAVVGVTVGLRRNKISGFTGWRFSAARATGGLSRVEGRTGTGLALEYDFTRSSATRAAYAAPPVPVEVAGQAQSFGMWIRGRGDREWPSLELIDGDGAAMVLRGEPVAWRGWRYVEMAVPPGASHPLTVRRFYVAQTDPAASHTGGIVVDELAANVPPEIVVPPRTVVADPLITPAVDGRTWRFAVMSDAQFVAREPDSDIVASARRTLREIKATGPDLLIVNGDLVDEGGPDDLAFARRVLTEELGEDVPWHYVPGNHEVMGGTIGDFIAEFGDPCPSFDHKGTRFITLNTAGLVLRSGACDQLSMLRERLGAAAVDDAVNSVVVVAHVPPRDPMPHAASRLSDRTEAAALEALLSRFGRDTGKGIGFIGGHVGAFAAWRLDGVPYLINGNSGKHPAAAPGSGGFIGWTEFGVDPVAADAQRLRRDNPYAHPPADWLAAHVRPQVDVLRLSGPCVVAVGDAVTVEAAFDQQDRTVPVAYPVSADWAASRGVYVGETASGPDRYRAWFHPRTGRLTGLGGGEITLAVTVNGVSAGLPMTVTGRAGVAVLTSPGEGGNTATGYDVSSAVRPYPA